MTMMMTPKELKRFKILALKFRQDQINAGNQQAADSIRYLVMEINAVLKSDIYDGIGDRCPY